MSECQLHLYIHGIASLVFGMSLQYPLSYQHSSSVKWVGSRPGRWKQCRSFLLTFENYRKTLVLFRGSGLGHPGRFIKIMCAFPNALGSTNQNSCVCWGWSQGSQRLVDFEQILKVSLKCCTGVGRRALGCV